MTRVPSRIATLAVLTAITPGFAAAQTPPGACTVNDASFTTADGGCKDLATGAVWSAEVPLGNYAFAESYCADLVEGGFDDWRIATLSEMAEFCADGAYTHVQTTDPGWRYFTRTNGNVGSIIRLSTCQVTKKVAVTNSFLSAFCVRGISKGGGKGNQGESGNPGGGEGAANEPPVQVHHELGRGQWTIRVTAPRYSGLPYALVLSALPLRAGVPVAAPFGGDASGSAVVLGDPQQIDRRGEATVVADARAPTAGSEWHLTMVVLDPEHGAVRAVVPLVSRRAEH